MRILAAAIDLAGQCRVECVRILARHGVSQAGGVSRFQHEREGPGAHQAVCRRQAAEAAVADKPRAAVAPLLSKRN